MDKHAFKMVIWLFSKKQQMLLAYSTRQYSSYFHMRCHLFFTKNWVYVNSSRICCVEVRFFVLKHMIQDCIVFLSCLAFCSFHPAYLWLIYLSIFCNILLMKNRGLHQIQCSRKTCWKKANVDHKETNFLAAAPGKCISKCWSLVI